MFGFVVSFVSVTTYPIEGRIHTPLSCKINQLHSYILPLYIIFKDKIANTE